MVKRFRLQAVRAVVGSLAVIAAGCGTESGLSPTGPTPGFSGDTIEIAPAGAIVGTRVILESRIASTRTAGSSFSYYWDFGDGSTASGGEAISHVYADAGTFVATVTASSSETGSVQSDAEHPGQEPHRRMVGRLRPSVDHAGRSRPPGKVPGRSARGHRRGKSQRDGYGDLHHYAPGPRPGHVHGNGRPGRDDARGHRERARRRRQALEARPQLLTQATSRSRIS